MFPVVSWALWVAQEPVGSPKLYAFDGMVNSFPFLSSAFLLHPPHLAQLRLHLSPATEAPTPADPPPPEKKLRTEAGKGDGKKLVRKLKLQVKKR